MKKIFLQRPRSIILLDKTAAYLWLVHLVSVRSLFPQSATVGTLKVSFHFDLGCGVRGKKTT